MRALISNPGFTVSLLVAVGVTTVFGLVFGVSKELFAILVILGIFTAISEYVLRSKSDSSS
jgi:presenilin-like A22 family membrane protease